MTQYEDRFKELSKFTLEGAKLKTELTYQFLRGLLPLYVETVAIHHLRTVKQMAEFAKGMEYVQLKGKRSQLEGSSSHQQTGGQSQPS